jgi:Putative regulator of cell autolysis
MEGDNAMVKTRTKTNEVLLHILCCLAFMAMPVFSVPGNTSFFDVSITGHYRDELWEYGLTIVFFYINYFYLIPHYYFRKKYVSFFLFALLAFIIVTVLPEWYTMSYERMQSPPGHMMEGHGPMPPPYRDGFDWGRFGPFADNFLKFALAFIISLTLKINSQLKKAQREKSEAEILFLKAQINPHFLFNTLNSIYSLALTKSDDTPKAVVKLSGMMRYTVSEASRNYVSLEKEVEYITNYISLQQLRLTSNVDLMYHTKGSFTGLQIAPFLLIPFVENSFKYGVNTDGGSVIRIDIAVEGDVLLFKAFNKKVLVRQSDTESTSLGIENTRKRLELMYGGKHKLQVLDNKDSFEVTLQLQLK